MTTLDSIFDSSPVAIDPGCKMEVNKANPPGGKADYEGQTYYFCAPGCLHAFEAEPSKFVRA